MKTAIGRWRKLGRATNLIQSRILRERRTEALQQQGGVCRYCLEPLTALTVTADHRKARSKGGTNAQDNIVACCGACNVAKGSMNAAVFTKAIKAPASGTAIAIWQTWARRRVWLATYRACRNIRYAAGLENNTPVGRTAA